MARDSIGTRNRAPASPSPFVLRTEARINSTAAIGLRPVRGKHCAQNHSPPEEESERMKKTRTTMMILGCLSLFACGQTPEEEQAVSAIESQSSALTLKVGVGQTYSGFSALPLLKPGDVVEVSGNQTYGAITLRAAGTAAAKITIRGVRVNGRRPIISGGINTVAFEGSHHVVFEGFEVTGGTSRCVFNHAANVTIRDTLVRDCPMHGILGADYDSGSLTLDRVEVTRSGYGDQKHPIY